MGAVTQASSVLILAVGNFLAGLLVGRQRLAEPVSSDGACDAHDRCLARLEASARFSFGVELGAFFGLALAFLLVLRRPCAGLRCGPCSRRSSEAATRAEVSAPARRRIEASIASARVAPEQVGAAASSSGVDSPAPASPPTYVPKRLRVKTSLQ